MGPRGPRPLARSACNYVWAGEGGTARSTRSRSSADCSRSVTLSCHTRVLRTGQFLYTQRISPTSCIATMDGCCIRYASMDPTSDRAFPYSLSPTQSDGQTPPFHSTKSLLNAASMRGFTNRMYAVSPLPPSLLVCAHFHHGRISRGSRCEGGRASIRPAAQTGVAYPINANIRGEQASKNLFDAAC